MAYGFVASGVEDWTVTGNVDLCDPHPNLGQLLLIQVNAPMAPARLPSQATATPVPIGTPTARESSG